MSAGVTLGRITSHISVYTDTSLSRWGSFNINCLELYTVLRVLKHFAPLQIDKHVMVRTDNKTTRAYINCQGSVCSAQVPVLARSLLLWSNKNLCSIRAVYILGKQNWAVDLMSQGGHLKAS